MKPAGGKRSEAWAKTQRQGEKGGNKKAITALRHAETKHIYAARLRVRRAICFVRENILVKTVAHLSRGATLAQRIQVNSRVPSIKQQTLQTSPGTRRQVSQTNGNSYCMKVCLHCSPTVYSLTLTFNFLFFLGPW